MVPNPWMTLVIVVLIFIGIAIGRYPIIKSNRTTIALMGVALLVVTNQVRFKEIPSYFDFDTLILLFSMMIINANLKLSGFFTLAGRVLVRLARSPRSFLALEILIAGVLSALFLNDTICLMFAPFIIHLTDRLKRNPMPYLIALATAANLGSVATPTGNPQNMIVGVASGLTFFEFVRALAPVAFLGMGVIWLILVRMYPAELRRGERFSLPESHPQEWDAPPEGFSPEGGPQEGSPQDVGDMPGGFAETISRPLLIKTLVIATGMLAAFLLGAPIALASFLAASILLVTRRHLPQMVFAEFDWTLLVFFAALFVVSGSLETSGVTRTLVDLEGLAQKANLLNLTAVTAVLSNLVSNVPAVLLLKPVVSSMANPHLGWLTLASASTLAGNLTLLGSVANLIVAETAKRWRIDLGFWEYTKSGFLITMITLLISLVWLYAMAPRF